MRTFLPSSLMLLLLFAAPIVVIAAKAGDPVNADAWMSFERRYFVYILASRIGGALYIGVTNDLMLRVFEHRSDVVDGFTREHGVHVLVHYEIYDDVHTAIQREKRLKKWNRAWKIRLIEENNPNWSDLYPSIARL